MTKLRNQKGFTLAELLVSLLIMGMLGVLVTGGISSAGRVRKIPWNFPRPTCWPPP